MNNFHAVNTHIIRNKCHEGKQTEAIMSMTISIDDELKRDFSEVCREIGLTPSTAFGIFARTVVRERAIPFELSAVTPEERVARSYDLRVADGVRRGLEQFEEGDFVSRSESRSLRSARDV
jgi:DNA-damage-inducible protein J